MKIRVSGLEVVATSGRPPSNLKVKSLALVCACLPCPLRYETQASLTLPPVRTSEGLHACTSPDPLTLRLPGCCCRVKVLPRDASSSTLAAFTTTSSETSCRSGNSRSQGLLRYEIKSMEDKCSVVSLHGEYEDIVDFGDDSRGSVGEAGARVSITDDDKAPADVCDDPICLSGDQSETVVDLSHQTDSTDNVTACQGGDGGDDNVAHITEHSTEKTSNDSNDEDNDDSDKDKGEFQLLQRRISQALGDMIAELRERKDEEERQQVRTLLLYLCIFVVYGALLAYYWLVFRPLLLTTRIRLNISGGGAA